MLLKATLADYWRRYERLSPWFAMACYILTLVAWGVLFLEPPTERLVLAAVLIPSGIITDYVLHKLQTGKPNLESSIITSGIVTLLMPFDIPIWQALVAVLLAILSKHFILWNKKHIFNPASFGVAITAAVFGYSLGWWPDSFVWVAVALGLINVWRVKKFPQLLSFGAVYLLLALVVQGQIPTTELGYNDLGNQTLYLTFPWFFALFMLPEPITSLQPMQKQLAFGAAAAAIGFGISYVEPLAGASLLWGLLAANLLAFVWKRHPTRATA